MNWPGEPTGDSKLAHWLKKLLRACKESHLVEGPGYRVKRGSGGTIIDVIPSGKSNIVGVYLLQTVEDDYIVAHRWDKESAKEGTEDILIAKPQKLRTSLSTEVKYGVTHTYGYALSPPDSLNEYRTDEWSTFTETQAVTPCWAVDDEIVALDVGKTIALSTATAAIRLTMVSPWRQWAKIP